MDTTWTKESIKISNNKNVKTKLRELMGELGECM